MKNVLAINDGSPEAANAIELGLLLALKNQSGFLLATVNKGKKEIQKSEYAVASYGETAVFKENKSLKYLEPMHTLNSYTNYLSPETREIDIQGFSQKDLQEMILVNEIDLVVLGCTTLGQTNFANSGPNIPACLKNITCPILLVPVTFKPAAFKQIVYATDLRFCQFHIIDYLTTIAKPADTNLMVAHISLNELPDMKENYASAFFTDEIRSRIRYEKLYFNHIKERNLARAVDVMVEVMKTELLVLIKNGFHFKEIFGNGFSGNVLQIQIPVLVFPY